MILKKIAGKFISKAEVKVGAPLDYVHVIAETDLSLLARYNKLFGFLDPNKKAPALAYHTARLRGARAADCGTCVQIESNLATQAGIAPEIVKNIIRADYDSLPAEIIAVAKLADAVVGQRMDAAEHREKVVEAFGQAGLIELSYAMNGAALLPGIKRSMGYATSCDLSLIA